jgi:2-polyprenyl-3-methyl-5-hydroxy-6-metoxy-1,4-benzoquinol methylase
VVSGSDADAEHMMRVNQANWDARTPIHVSSRFYGLDGTVNSADWFADFEWTDLGELAGRDVVHLQCRLGTETVVFAERGARTVGLDISSEWIKQARRIAAEQGADVERTTHPFDVRAAGPRALRG